MLLGSILDVIDEAVLGVVIAACAVLSVLTMTTVGRMRRPRALAIVTGALLACALLLAALAGGPAPAGLVVFVAVCALVVAVAGGSQVSRLVLERTTFDEIEGRHGGVMAADGRELLRGGRMIGLLERLAVAGAVIAGYPDALAVVIAIKGVGRFSELENGAVRERFIVGTLVSWIWAAAAACVVLLARS